MKRFVLGAAVFSALVPAAADVAMAQDRTAEQPTVVAIEFRGNARTPDDTLRLSLRTKIGQRLDRALLPEDVNSLLESFQSVDLKEERTATGVKLVFTVVESAPVTAVDIVGTDGLSLTEVSDIVETKAGLPLAEFRVANDQRKIERLYRSKGWHFIQVTPRIEASGDGKRVVFEILEGPQVEIGTITFEGNTSFPKDKLLERVAMRETKFIGLVPGYFVEETIRQDLLSIRNFYRSEGWLDAQVELADRRFSDDRKKATVEIRVTEGAPYTIGALTIDGVRTYPGGGDALLALLAVKQGDRKRQESVFRGLEQIERAYREEGFFAAVATPEEKLRPNEPVVDIVIHVDEASKVKVRRFDVVGNVVTQDKVIRREVPIGPGDVLNQNSIDKGVQRLRSLGYFERVSARVEAAPEGEDPNQRDVTIEVDDTAATGSIRFGVGVSSDRGLSATMSLTKRNFDWKDWPKRFGDVFRGKAFTGAGQTFSLELSPGNDYSQYRIAFTEPWMFDKPISFGWDLFLTQERRFDYDQDAKGLDFFLGRRWLQAGRERDTVVGVQARTRLESIDVTNLDRQSSPTAFLARGGNSLISEELTLRMHRLDSEANPTDGWFGEASTEFGFAGDIQLWKNSVQAKKYWLLFKNEDERSHVLALGAKLSVASAMGSSVEADPNLFDTSFVPVYEGYFAGGSSTVRGFSYGGAGPHGQGDPFLARRPGETAKQQTQRLEGVTRSVLENDGDPLGGSVQFVASTEYTFPMYEDMLRGVFFLDAGMVRSSFSSSHGLDEDVSAPYLAGAKFSDGESFFSDMRAAIGFGVRLRIPALGPVPLALDVGIPIRKQDGDDTQIISFTIQRNF
ncbi:MAG: outer membrane protein assembly factor BamA [Planctomycetes bacterium]|nr:outer membrane protein assembly factor BamA [Planctomycetota bacterium]